MHALARIAMCSSTRAVRRGAVLGLLLVLGAGSSPAAASKRAAVPCPDGLFLIQGNSPISPGAAPPTLTLRGGHVSLSSGCTTAMPAQVKAHRRATVVSAGWPSCTGLVGPVLLKARIASPACGTLVGRLILRKTKPKKRQFSATRQSPAALIATLSDVDTQVRMLAENSPSLIRGAAEAYNPEVTELIAEGPGDVDAILERFQPPAGLPDDIPLSLFAYALERIGDPRAVPVLADWLDQNLFATTLWATDFVTHTIKVLAHQPGLNTATYTYLIDEKLDTIAAARAGASGLTAAARHAAIEPATVAPNPDHNKCEKTIIVTGINAAGQQQSLTFNFATLRLDLQEQIDALPTDDPRRAQLMKNQEDYRAIDKKNYDGTGYDPIPGDDVSVGSNCGGSVAERLLNAVAAQKGLPVRLGTGGASADNIRDIARTFGSEVGIGALDPLTVVAHERASGSVAHVEIPLSVDGSNVVVYSKDNYGIPRLHTVNTGLSGSAANFWGPVQNAYNFRPFLSVAEDATTPKFYRIDPTRITSIVVDSSACPCDAGATGPIAVAITQPTETTTDQRVITVAGTVDDPSITSGTLRVNQSPQGVTVSAGTFSSQVVLSSGDNTIKFIADAYDGRRGCTETTIHSTTPRTTILVTLTWTINDADLDLYVTQPDGETAWYANKVTSIGGQLDVDNTQGFGPENYLLSSEAGNTVLPGTYAVAVHYYSDHLRTADTPTRIATWRVVTIVNEGSPGETRAFASGSLGVDNASNATPGGTGPDWATVGQVTIPNG
jgi:uncharacterized protein YfaP (DUF2135 family)